MEIHDTPLKGLKVIVRKAFHDSRGFFTETYNESYFRGAGIAEHFVQDNHSRSLKGVLRGLHFQPKQCKLVSVVRGKVWDVAVDIRRNSKTFGQYFGIELSDCNFTQLWIPDGFAHGFCVLGDESADLNYKVTSHYDPKTESGFRWNSADLLIKWPISTPIVSDRDKALPIFEKR